ncbi:MAG: FAD-dependent oxidoreductase [Acidobacteriia bacterium]|nr:FAD-dependent oxidoreductase [Terriglobia bacterium]
MQNHTLITFSHLRWDFVYQRPQHLLSRLAASHRVIFIEEPVFIESPRPQWQFSRPEPNVLVCRPQTPSREHGFHQEQMRYLKELVRELIETEGLSDYVLWFYTPMALPLAEEFKPLAVVYDCMDELSAFLNAPRELLEREAALLSMADLVFTGGPSLYRAKKDRHPHVHCFPSSVDAKHFAAAANGMTEAADQADLPHPRLGFFGVIDERFDVPLLRAMADAHPEWQLAMVGPVVKIDPAILPRNPNIRYFGQRSYQQLPAYLKGWDVCLLPFARNESTKYISPTKTLEYMAAGRMIVSAPIRDVAEPYSDIVYLGATPEEFIAACERALSAGPRERSERQQKMREVLGRTSWDSTAARMRELIEEAIRGRRAAARPSRAPAARTVVVGAGPTGLSAAYHLGEDSVLLEQNGRVGGWCRSIEVNGFTFDYAGHIMFSNEPYVHQLYKMLLGDNVHWQDREAWVYSKGVYTRYPFQGSLYGLPPAVIKECIVGAIEARFGPLKPPKTQPNGKANGSNGKTNGNGAYCKPGDVKDCCADGILEASAALVEQTGASGTRSEPRNFEEFIYKVWGAGIAKHFAIPYNRKLWAVPLNEMETSWLGGRVPLPDLEEMVEGALSPKPKPMGPNARFGYPLRGGFQALMDGWLPFLKGEVRMNARVVGVSPRRRTVTLSDGSRLEYGHLVSTRPLPALIRQMGDEAPAGIRAAAAALRHVSVRCVHLGVGRENLTEKHWIYYPEDTVFHRIFVQGNASPYCNPPGAFGLTCEITYSPQKPLPCDGDDLVKRCIDDCRKVGFFRREDPIRAAAQCDLPYAYVVYDHGRAQAVAGIREWLLEQNIILSGRYSEWEYYNSDHAFIAGKKAADQVQEMGRRKMIAGLVAQEWQGEERPA